MSTPPRAEQDEIMTSPGDASLLESFIESPHTATHTLAVENHTTLKARKCRLTVFAGPDIGKEINSDKERLRIGGHSTNDLVLTEDRTVSRHHYELQYTERGYLLIDLNSTNGTWLDGRRIERAYLSPSSVIRSGQTECRFTIIDEEVTVLIVKGGVPALHGLGGCLAGGSRKDASVHAFVDVGPQSPRRSALQHEDAHSPLRELHGSPPSRGS